MVVNRIKTILEEQGKSLYWLSAETGVSYERLRRHYHNRPVMIRYHVLDSVCKALGKDVGDVLVLNSKKKTKK